MTTVSTAPPPPPSVMNPTTDQLPPPPAVPTLQPPRSSFSCDRHPDENFTGFCPSCLCERLTTLDQSANAAVASSSSRRNSTSSIKAIFRVSSSSEANKNKTTAATATRNSFFPELRRTKSFSASKNDGLAISACVYEPQRKSCDVRGRNTLWSLFSIHDENKPRHSYSQQQTLGNNGVVLETDREDEEEEEDEEHEEDQIHHIDDEEEEDEEIRVSEEHDARIVNDLENNIVEEAAEIEQKIEKKEESESVSDELKPMRDHIDLDSQSKKASRSNFWSAASVLTKKWHKWRRKQKDRVAGTNGVILSSTLPVEKPISRQYRETQSEIADYGFGRQSCDTDPRFSLDVGRISFDDPRYSFDEPRASWDGYLIGKTFPRLPPMVEDPLVVHVPRCDSQIPVENLPVPDDNAPGGSIQTREYYLDSSSKRRKSLDRSNSIRKMAAAVVAELDETKVVSSGTIDPPRVSNSNSNSLRDDCSETFELGFRDNVIHPIGGEKEAKKPRKWRWKLWGFIHRRSKDDDEDRCSTVSGVGRSYSESWQDCNNEVNSGFNRKVLRSNSSVSWRSSSLRKSNPNNINSKFGKNTITGDEFVLERNRNARYSPNHIDNGLLRFYLAPLSGSRRSGIGISTGKSRPMSNSHSIARSMLGLY
ncbi:hypothetical protein L1987_21650 [Smallanthus sonchifolius]|uniref:Uncharacterized protein n=1 Tax=Smallanthus sonchifolius TaxID=185202 RepID=A0ACB9IE41_9ASTR|nr:hypothetical protein L1987_21650 [Smallanthus sonchifolius]